MPRASARSAPESKDSRPFTRRPANRPLPAIRTMGAVSRCSRPWRKGAGAAQPRNSKRPEVMPRPRSDGPSAGQIEPGGAGPARPAAVAAELEPERPPRSQQGADDAVFGRVDAGVEIEAVAVGLGVEPKREALAAALHGQIDGEQCAPAPQLALGVEAADPLAPGDPRPEPELPNVEPAEMNVVIGQDGLRLGGRIEPRRPAQDDEIRIDLVEGQGAEHIIDRPPIHVDPRRLGEQAVGIVDPDVDQPGAPVDRAVDPADLDPEARRGSHRRDPVDDEAVAGLGVEKGQEGGEPEREDQRDGDERLGDPRQPDASPRPDPRGRLLLRRRGRRIEDRVGHIQKAWPSET